ncbi:arylesterase [Sansalvadorimonas sp. 2012CJ34-2]|uniref:Arylesterase n=1 Tax=Parendozoicomonas callyspongiae TaxID=2942213 RepID=A0ABT0PG11_9GAMM|nr:arylesterase [Sansalvadorimonas sp. 2012CJ34-2]MCL6270318.1 arylesterase [Sansalvadorimonas sp. 2012CJ34-2]
MPFIVRCRLLPLVLLSLFALNAWSAQKTLLVFGDSLSAAYGIDINKGWVSLLQDKLKQSYPNWQVINLSISGETTAGGLSRFPDALEKHNPDMILLELGANDGLRGTPIKSMRTNLEQMLTQASKEKIPVMLFEMHIPPNYGGAYTRMFNQTFHKLADRKGVTLLPFFLEGVAGNDQLNQVDGIHPKAEAQPKVFQNIWPRLKPLLD